MTGGVTPVYAAPETFEGWVSRFSDQYSLAIVFQELLTGTRPFNGSNTRQLLMQHLNGTPDVSILPPDDQPIIARALSKKPDDRWPTCTEMVQALKLLGVAATRIGDSATRGQVSAAPGSVHRRPSGRPAMGRPGSHGPDSVHATRTGSRLRGPHGRGAARATGQNPNTAAERLPPLIKPPGPGNVPGGAPLPPTGIGSRLVTPAATGTHFASPAQTLNRPPIFQTGRMGSLGVAPPERSGDGALFPALDRCRRPDRHGGSSSSSSSSSATVTATRTSVPNIRILHIDTDPEMAPAAPAETTASLTPREVGAGTAEPARRTTSSAIRSRRSISGCRPGRCTSSPRTPGSADGSARVRPARAVRQLPRHRPARSPGDRDVPDRRPAGRSRTSTPSWGCERTGPGHTSSPGWPAAPASGMFLDLAYLVRHELRQVGYLKPEVVGCSSFRPRTARPRAPWRWATRSRRSPSCTISSRGRRVTRRRSTSPKRRSSIRDPPFVACRRPAAAEGANRPTQARSRTSWRPARCSGNAHAGRPGRRRGPRRVPQCVSDGRADLPELRPVPAELAAAGDARGGHTPVRAAADPALDGEGGRAPARADRRVAGPSSGRAQAALRGDGRSVRRVAVRDALREEPERVFDAFIDPLRTRTPSGGRLDAASACTVLEQLLKVVGKPDSENDPMPGSLRSALNAKYEQWSKEAESAPRGDGRDVPRSAAVSDCPGPRKRSGRSATSSSTRWRRSNRSGTISTRKCATIYGRLIQAIGALGRDAGSATAVAASRTRPRSSNCCGSTPASGLQLHILDMVLSVYRKLLRQRPGVSPRDQLLPRPRSPRCTRR